MKNIKPFQALHFNQKKVNLSNVICPPYDVIDTNLSKKLAKKSPYNSIFLSFNVKEKQGRTKYKHISRLISKWKSKSILVMDSKPMFYYLEEKFRWKGKIKSRKGIFALVPVLNNKNIIPHEKVFPEAVLDRLNLLQSSKTHVSPIFLVYEDLDKKFTRWLDQKTTKDLEPIKYASDQIHYRFGAIQDTHSIHALQKIFKGKDLLIADGHHRFATAQKFSKKIGKDIHLLAFISPSKNLVFSYHKVLSTILDSNKVTTRKILKTCKKGQLLPQKSTYFYPKVMTGFVMSVI